MKNIFIISLVLLVVSACQQKEAQTLSEQEKVNESKIIEVNNPNHENLKGCTKEAKVCPDGSTVGRNPQNSCKFDACPKKSTKPTAKMCTADVKQCPDGSYVSRDHYNNCEFKACPHSKKLPTK
jgi:hypothetical protein